MDERTEALLKKINRGILVNRIFLVLTMLIASAALVFSIITNIKFDTFIEQVTPAIENLTNIDIDGLNDTLHTVNKLVDTFKIDETLEMLSKIDFNAFNNVVSNIDVNELNTTLDHMNESYVAIKEVTEKLKPLLSFFGGKQ